MRRTRFIAAVMFGLLASACGGATKAAMVSVELKEFSMSANRASIAAGKITMTARNEGTTTHEVVVLRTDLPAGSLPTEGDRVNEEAAGLTSIGEIGEFAAGKTESKTFEFSRGTYVLICNVATHYRQGMRMTLTVT